MQYGQAIKISLTVPETIVNMYVTSKGRIPVSYTVPRKELLPPRVARVICCAHFLLGCEFQAPFDECTEQVPFGAWDDAERVIRDTV